MPRYYNRREGQGQTRHLATIDEASTGAALDPGGPARALRSIRHHAWPQGLWSDGVTSRCSPRHRAQGDAHRPRRVPEDLGPRWGRYPERRTWTGSDQDSAKVLEGEKFDRRPVDQGSREVICRLENPAQAAVVEPDRVIGPPHGGSFAQHGKSVGCEPCRFGPLVGSRKIYVGEVA